MTRTQVLGFQTPTQMIDCNLVLISDGFNDIEWLAGGTLHSAIYFKRGEHLEIELTKNGEIKVWRVEK